MRFEPRRRSGRSRGSGGSAECRSNADPRRAKRGVAPSRSTITHCRLGCHYAGGVRKWFPLSLAEQPADGELRSGRLAQRERRTLTRSRSGVQIPHRPPLKPQAIGLFARWPLCFRRCRALISQASCGSCGIGRAGLQADAPRRFSNRAPARPGGLRSPTHPVRSVAVRPWDARQIGALVGNVISVPAFRCEARRAAFRISHLERRRPLGAQLPTCSSCVRRAFAFDPRWIRGGNAFDPPLLRIGSIGLAGEAAVPSGHDTLARWAPPRLGPAARSE